MFSLPSLAVSLGVNRIVGLEEIPELLHPIMPNIFWRIHESWSLNLYLNMLSGMELIRADVAEYF